MDVLNTASNKKADSVPLLHERGRHGHWKVLDPHPHIQDNIPWPYADVRHATRLSRP